MTTSKFDDCKNPVDRARLVIEPAQVKSFFSLRQLKEYDDTRLCYKMSAETNGKLITSGVPGEMTPKRECLNNNHVAHYIDTDFGQDLSNCSAVLYVSMKFMMLIKIIKNC